jgi:hypothetical protein
MFAFPDLNSNTWETNGYFRAGPSPYILKMTHDGLFMNSADAGPTRNAICSFTWSSVGAGPFDEAYRQHPRDEHDDVY